MTTEQRLQRIEDDNRVLRRQLRALRGTTLGLVALWGVTALLASAIAQPAPPVDLRAWDTANPESASGPVLDVIRTRRIEIVVDEAASKPAAVLGVTAGIPFLELRTDSGTTGLRLDLDERGVGALRTHDEKGHEIVAAVATSEGRGELRLGDGRGRTGVRLHVDPKGDGRAALANKDGYDVVQLAATSTHHGYLAAHDHVGRRLALIGGSDEGQGSLVVNNGYGHPIFGVDTDLARNGRLTVHSFEGAALAIFPQLPPVADEGDNPPLPPHLRDDGEPSPVGP